MCDIWINSTPSSNFVLTISGLIYCTHKTLNNVSIWPSDHLQAGENVHLERFQKIVLCATYSQSLANTPKTLWVLRHPGWKPPTYSFKHIVNTVKPLDRSGDPKIVAVVDRCLLFKGHLSNSNSKWDPKLVVVVGKWSLFGGGC